MSLAVYVKIKTAVLVKDSLFKQGEDCTGNKSSSTDQRIVAAILQLSHGVAVSFLTTDLWLSESLIYLCRQRFVAAVVEHFGGEYLRWPNEQDLSLLMKRHAKLGSPGALSSLYCAGWKLHREAVAHQRRNIRKAGAPELRFECVADDQLWVWHLVFGFRGAMNELNVLYYSTLFARVRAGTWPEHQPEMNIASNFIDSF